MWTYRDTTGRVTIKDGEAVGLGKCKWFALCENEATHLEPHVILGAVPCCERCAKVGA